MLYGRMNGIANRVAWKRSVSCERGVTLVELLVVIAIIGIMVMIGLNLMGGSISRYRLRTAAEDMMGRLRSAKMLSIVHNQHVGLAFNSSSYTACFDLDQDSVCESGSGEDYLNIDSGREAANADLAEYELPPLVEAYGLYFGDGGTPNGVVFAAPSGLPVTFKNGTDIVEGEICLRVPVDEDRYEYRRVSVNPFVGTVRLWVVNASTASTPPVCDGGYDEWVRYN